MTNKVKPFYIRITDDMTPQMVQDAFDKCVDAGAKHDEWETSLELSDWEFFGFCGVSGMYLTDYSEDYEANSSGDAQEITLDQLDEWLWLEVKHEWKNGDECMIRGEKLIYIGESIEADIHCVQELGSCLYRNAHISVIEKPETPEQKAERERLEAAYDLYCECVMHGNGGPVGFKAFKSSHIVNLTWLRIVDKTNYRKQ